MIREGVSAALAETGREDDPRLRGAAHKLLTEVSEFLRSPLADNPFVKKSTTHFLNPQATPPSWWSLALIASMPSLQRERGALLDRLGQYLARPFPEQPFSVIIGTRSIRAPWLILGDPIGYDSKGLLKDIPLTLHFIELLAGIGQLKAVPAAIEAFHRLMEEVDSTGLWYPRNLRSQPKAVSPVTYHMWPLLPDDGSLEARQADITFRLARIAKVLGCQLEYS